MVCSAPRTEGKPTSVLVNAICSANPSPTDARMRSRRLGSMLLSPLVDQEGVFKSREAWVASLMSPTGNHTADQARRKGRQPSPTGRLVPLIDLKFLSEIVAGRAPCARQGCFRRRHEEV